MAEETRLKAVDFFCGGGGMTHGFKQAGVNVLAGVDIDPKCQETYEFNNRPSKFILADIKSLSIELLIKDVGVKRDDDDLIFIGCSPCQYWSILKTDKTKANDSKNLLNDFQKFVDYFNPGFVVVENVPGIYSKPDSPLKSFIQFLAQKGYTSIVHQIIKVSDYGVPQSRRRFVLIASRVKTISFPQADNCNPPTVRNFIGDKKKFPEIKAGHKDPTGFCHTVQKLEKISLQRLALTPKDGGTRAAWEESELQIEAYRKKKGDKSFRFRDIYGRMFWDKPAPTITTRFNGVSNGRFTHPEQDRAISLREGATLQTFPLNYIFKVNTIHGTARLIGNAVPPELARRIAKTIISCMK